MPKQLILFSIIKYFPIPCISNLGFALHIFCSFSFWNKDERVAIKKEDFTDSFEALHFSTNFKIQISETTLFLHILTQEVASLYKTLLLRPPAVGELSWTGHVHRSRAGEAKTRTHCVSSADLCILRCVLRICTCGLVLLERIDELCLEEVKKWRKGLRWG